MTNRIRERANRACDRLAASVAWMLPRRLVYWAAIRATAHATAPPYGNTEVPAIPAMEVLRRWSHN